MGVLQRLGDLATDARTDRGPRTVEQAGRVLVGIGPELVEGRQDVRALQRGRITSLERSKHVPQGRAAHVLHREEGHPVLAADREDGHDARVCERGDGRDLALEPLSRAGEVQVLRAHQLERDLPAQGQLFGAVDDAHPAAADRLDQPEVPQTLGELVG